MESVDMDISTSDKEEEEEDDDDEDVAKLLSCLNGIEKCFLRVNNEPGKTVTAPEKKPVPNGNENNKIWKEKVNRTHYTIRAVSPTSSNASTLSRESTPEKQLSHCPKDCNNINGGQSAKPTVTIAQLLDKDSDDDVIIENINEIRKTLEAKSDSDHSDITFLGTNSGVPAVGTKSSAEPMSSRNPEASAISTDSVMLDSTTTSSTKSNQREGESLTTVPATPQSEQTDKNPAKDDESDSDCLIVEHIAPSEHLQNGLIDLTKPTSDEETSLPLQERTEESLLKEISKIRKALTKHSKKHKKEKKKHKSHKKKKRSKSKSRAKSPSLDKVSESDNENDENESRTILMSNSGVLRVNITTTNDKSKSDSDDSVDSSKTNKSKTTIPLESEGNLRSPPKNSNCEENSSFMKENEPEAGQLLENPNSEDEIESGELPENPVPENKADGEESPALWNSDCEDTVDYEKPYQLAPAPVLAPASTQIEWKNPLRRKLSSFNDNFKTRQPLKKIFCESGKELKSTFRRNAERNLKKKALFDKTSKFNRYLSHSDDSDSSNRKPPQRVPSVDKFNRFTIDSNPDKSSNSTSGKKFRKVADSDTDDALRMKSPAYSIFDTVCHFNRGRSRSIHNDKYRSNRSRSQFKSKSRSPSCYRRSPSSYRNSPLSRRSRSRHKTPAKNPDYDFSLASPSCSPPFEMRRSPSRSYRSKSRTLRSPSRSRRSRYYVYRSPSRSRRSKSRTYRSPSHSRRSRSRTYRSPSRSHRSKSRRRTPRRRSESRSPSEIRAARKWSPLENMRQQLRKNNEAAVQQALGGLEKPKKKAKEARIIDDVDLTNSPTPEPSFVAMTASASVTTQAVVSQQRSQMHQYNAAALPQNYPVFLDPFAVVRPRDLRPHPNFVPMSMLRTPGILNQTGVFQISHVYSHAAGPPESYVPMYSQPHPPYM